MSRREALLKVSSAEFRDIAVSPCRVQKPSQRFGDGAAETMEARAATELYNMVNYDSVSSSDSEDDSASAQTGPPASRPARRKPPKLQNFRMNLTALSQVYNLYFAAYRNKIWVYCPAGPMAQDLGGKAALVINHSMSSVGARIESKVRGWKKDDANHMIVGFLGDAEILLLCYENGDVTSYHTREIAAYIAHRAQHPDSALIPCPGPFFRANVGLSAWGLAIHSKSRLVAVSSNRHEVTVFAFALTDAPAPGRFLTPPHSPVESAVLARKRNWRIVLPVKRTGSYIPNVDFVSSALGHAQKISAVDINGHIWLLDIWRQETAPALIVPQDTEWMRLEEHRSWAVVALPSSSFMELGARRHHSPRTYLSAEASHARAIALGNGNIPIELPFKNSRYWVDTTSAMALIQDSRPLDRTQPHPLSSLLNPLTGNNTPAITAATLTAAPSGDEEGAAEESAGTENDEDEGGDDDSDDVIDDQDQPDTDENEVDGGEYDEGDLEAEVSSWGDEDDDDDENDDTALDWGSNVASTNSWSDGTIFGNPGPEAPLVLEPYLPNDTGQFPGQTSLIISTMNQLTDAPNTFDISKRKKSPPLLDDGLPQDATEQREEFVDGQPAPRMGMIYDPRKGMTYREPADDRHWAMWLRRAKEYNQLTAEQNQAEIAALGEHTSLFAADDKDLRLLTTNRRFVDIYCRGPAAGSLSHPGYAPIRRVNMTLHVPELNLVVAACQSGRVALVTLVRCPWALPTVCGDRSMRVDRVLPTAAEEGRRGVRPRVPLFGVAVGPVQEVDDDTLRLRARGTPASFSCMYRLVLHFRDHTVLSYLVSRPSPDDLRVI